MNKMNRAQRVIVIVALVLIAVSCAYPCWTVYGKEFKQDLGYGHILKCWAQKRSPVIFRIDTTRLITQCVGVIALAGGAFLLAGFRK